MKGWTRAMKKVFRKSAFTHLAAVLEGNIPKTDGHHSWCRVGGQTVHKRSPCLIANFLNTEPSLALSLLK
jgi:hypothetical protein